MNYLTTKETANKLNITVGTLRNWVSAKKIPYKKANGKLLFDQDELEVWLANRDSLPKFSNIYANFDAAFTILKSISNLPHNAIDVEKNYIDFSLINKSNISQYDKNLIELAANFYKPDIYRFDFLNKLYCLNKKDQTIVINVLEQRLKNLQELNK